MKALHSTQARFNLSTSLCCCCCSFEQLIAIPHTHTHCHTIHRNVQSPRLKFIFNSESGRSQCLKCYPWWKGVGSAAAAVVQLCWPADPSHPPRNINLSKGPPSRWCTFSPPCPVCQFRSWKIPVRDIWPRWSPCWTRRASIRVQESSRASRQQSVLNCNSCW